MLTLSCSYSWRVRGLNYGTPGYPGLFFLKEVAQIHDGAYIEFQNLMQQHQHSTCLQSVK